MYGINARGKSCKLTAALIIYTIERIGIGGIRIMGYYGDGPVVVAAGGVGTADGQGNTAIQCIGAAICAAFGIDHIQSVISGSKVTESGGALPLGSSQTIGIGRCSTRGL
jgi:hypothetical protein